MSRELSKLFIVAGSVGVIGSIIWWNSFYTQVYQFLGNRGALPTECLYTVGGPCGLVTGIATAVGVVAYDPKLFWGSAAAFLIGAIMRALPEANRQRDGLPKTQTRNDPDL